MPKDIFNDELSREIGIIPRTRIIYLVLCDSLNIPPGDIPRWADVDEAIIRRRSKSLKIDSDGPAEAVLAKIEERYLEQSAQVYSVPPSWEQISQAYQNRTRQLSVEERKREQKRFQTALALQLNKFTATWKQISKELDDLGLTSFVNI